VRRIFLTGADTEIGALALATAAARPDVERIYTLEERPGPGVGKRFGLAGDLRAPRCGLDDASFADLAAATDTVIHCAERGVIDHDLTAARAANVAPLHNLVELVARNPDARLVHLSSVLVAGDKRGLFTEFDLECGQSFHNAYERSKYEAELLLRAAPIASRVTLVRRSFTRDAHSPVGALLSALRRRVLLIAGDPRMRLDLVSTEHVAAGLVALAGDPGAIGKTLHIVAGCARARPLGELVAAGRRDVGRAAAHFLPPAFAWLAPLLRALGLGAVPAHPALAPYFRHRATFDDYQGRTLLAAHGLAAHAPERGLAELLRDPPAR